MKEKAVELVLRNPQGEIDVKHQNAIAPRLKDLNGKRIALIHNNKNGMVFFLDAVEKLLKARYKNLTFTKKYHTEPNLAEPQEFYDEIAKTHDAFVFGAGD
jgi:hypothetical protein